MVKQITIVKALRGEQLNIKLGKVFIGTLTAWMAKQDTALVGSTYRSFTIDTDNNGITMSQDKMMDFVDAQGKTIEIIAGTWLYDVKEDGRVVVQGKILVLKDRTGVFTVERTVESY